VKGFSTKFFTKDGNYDLICSNMPMFFINEAKKLPQLIKAFAPKRDTDLADNESLWRFLAENPEAINIITWLYSDRGTTKSYRHIEGYSVNTYKWVNADGDTHFVRYKWIPLGGVKEISRNEAEFLSGFDPDVASKDLYEAIEDGGYPEYELAVQLVSEKNKEFYHFDLFDCTIAWHEKEIPYTVIGKMVLNKLPEDFYEEVEKSSFSPSRLTSGIAFSEDKLLEVISFACNMEARSRGAWV
jgi:catalase